MNKKDLVNAVVDITGGPKNLAENYVDATIVAIRDALVDGQLIRIEGFATLTPGLRPARAGRNPQTGEPLQLDAKPKVSVRLHSDMLRRMR